MRLIYLYTSIGSNPTKSEIKWEKATPESNPTCNPYCGTFSTEGMFWLWKEMLHRKVVDEVLIFAEMARNPGIATLAPGMTMIITPCIWDWESFLKEGDVVLARGGFRPWPPFLKMLNDCKFWVMFYQAATNRGGWPYWDVVLNDLISDPLADPNLGRGALHFNFSKPVHPDIFHYVPGIPKKWDVVINASHIHDRKAQWRVIEAAVQYKLRYQRDLVCSLPGGFYHGTNTNKIPSLIKAHKLKVATPGMVSRHDVANIMRESRLYINLGSGGQNDRGALEALACGTPVLIGLPRFFGPFVYRNHMVGRVSKAPGDPAILADEIHEFLTMHITEHTTEKVALYYSMHNGPAIAADKMEGLLTYMKANPVPNRKAICSHYGV